MACAAGLVMAIVWLPFGAVMGAVTAHSEDEISAATESLRTAIAELTMDNSLVVRVVEAGSELEGTRLVAWAGGDPGEGDRSVAYDMPDSILRIYVTKFDLTDWTIFLRVHAHLYRTIDDTTLFLRTWEYRSRSHGFFEMAEHDARLLRAEIDAGIQTVAEKIVQDLFIATDAEVHRTGIVPAGSVWTVESWSSESIDEQLSVDVVELAPFGAIAISTTSRYRWGVLHSTPKPARCGSLRPKEVWAGLRTPCHIWGRPMCGRRSLADRPRRFARRRLCDRRRCKWIWHCHIS